MSGRSLDGVGFSRITLYNLLMSTETEIQAEVEALKARLSDTKQLYREVCALLFFRHGITPTTNKLYQYVRRGSMSAPADALSKFWDDLRSKARIEVDHPDLPDEVKESAASAIAAIWRQASAAAREELRSVRDEAGTHVTAAQEELAAACRQVDEQSAEMQTLHSSIAVAQSALDSTKLEIETERRAHAATSARLQELQRTCDDLRSQQQRLQEGFSADLDKAREAVEVAATRADAADRRAMLEVDQERQARIRTEKALEALRSQASHAEDRLRTELQAATETGARSAARADSLEAASRDLQTRVDVSSEAELELRAQLRGLEDELARAKTQAETLQAVLDRLTPPSATSPAKPTKSRKS